MGAAHARTELLLIHMKLSQVGGVAWCPQEPSVLEDMVKPGAGSLDRAG